MDNKINVYTCPNGHQTVTLDVAEGTTPQMIQCPACLAEKKPNVAANSAWYMVAQDLTPTHEWYKPSDIIKVPKNLQEHVAAGGLLLREIATQKPTDTTLDLSRVHHGKMAYYQCYSMWKQKELPEGRKPRYDMFGLSEKEAKDVEETGDYSL
jgi:hypothetical protein